MRNAIVVLILALIFLLVLRPAAADTSHASTAVSGNLVVANSALTNSSATAKVFLIIVGSAGFNGSGGPMSIRVNQGDNVTIKFLYGDGNLSFDNPHVMRVEGYNIETGKIDRATPLQEVTFAAGQVGSFQFHCIIPCFGMENLQQGTIIVSASAQGTSTATNFGGMKIETRGDSLTISARLIDVDGTSVPGAIVNFLVNTDFGQLNLGHNVTGPDGTVQFVYSPTSQLPREMMFTAYFAGGGHYSECKATALYSPPVTQPSSLMVLVNPGLIYPPARLTTPYVSGQNPTLDLRLVGIPPIPAWIIVSVGLIVVTSVWSVYALVLKEMLAIRRGSERRREDWWTTES